MSPQQKILTALLFVFALAVVFIKMFNGGAWVYPARALFFIVLTTNYKLTSAENFKNSIFYFFLIFTINEILGALTYIPNVHDNVYTIVFYCCNFLYITSYIVLLKGIINEFKSKLIIKKAAFSFFVMLVFGLYLGFNTAEIALSAESDQGFILLDHILLVLYVTVLIVVLIASLLNYLTQESGNALIFLLAIICIVFAEIIQISTLYHIKEPYVYGVVYTFLLVLGFITLHYQSTLNPLGNFKK